MSRYTNHLEELEYTLRITMEELEYTLRITMESEELEYTLRIVNRMFPRDVAHGGLGLHPRHGGLGLPHFHLLTPTRGGLGLHPASDSPTSTY
jgi:hypothetical protein